MQPTFTWPVVGSLLDMVILDVIQNERIVDSDGEQLESITLGQAIAALLAAVCGSRTGIGGSTITTTPPRVGGLQITATRTSGSVIRPTLRLPAG